MKKGKRASRPIFAVHILFALLLMSMYLPGNAGSKASPVCITAACVMVELIVIICIVRGKKSCTAGDIGTVVFLLLLI